MLTRFLGNGIGHKGQVHHPVLSGDEDEDEDEDGPELIEDNDNNVDSGRLGIALLVDSHDGEDGLGDDNDNENSGEDMADEDLDDIGYEEL